MTKKMTCFATLKLHHFELMQYLTNTLSSGMDGRALFQMLHNVKCTYPIQSKIYLAPLRPNPSSIPGLIHDHLTSKAKLDKYIGVVAVLSWWACLTHLLFANNSLLVFLGIPVQCQNIFEEFSTKFHKILATQLLQA